MKKSIINIFCNYLQCKRILLNKYDVDNPTISRMQEKINCFEHNRENEKLKPSSKDNWKPSIFYLVMSFLMREKYN